MATAEQIKSLIRSHVSDDEERFYTVVLQVAAHEAQQGHGALAHDIREIIDKARRSRRSNLIKFPQDLSGMVFAEEGATPLSALVMPQELRDRIARIIHEHRQQEKLKSHGLTNRRKILLVGPPGTGKTMTARVLSHELHMPLFTIQVDKLVTKFMGETSAKLRQIFDLIRDRPGIYLFDEFDAIGGDRSLDSDVGEMRRVLNALLQFIEQLCIGFSCGTKLFFIKTVQIFFVPHLVQVNIGICQSVAISCCFGYGCHIITVQTNNGEAV
ncbi:MAG: AAA family ATPase, partial [Proteobacteria bacterium]